MKLCGRSMPTLRYQSTGGGLVEVGSQCGSDGARLCMRCDCSLAVKSHDLGVMRLAMRVAKATSCTAESFDHLT